MMRIRLREMDQVFVHIDIVLWKNCGGEKIQNIVFQVFHLLRG
jgi:hypothetical protein